MVNSLLFSLAAGATATCNFSQYLQHKDTEKSFGGYTLFAPGGLVPEGRAQYLIDADGKVVHEWNIKENLGCFPGVHLQRDGNLLLSYCPTQTASGRPEGGGIMRADWDGNVVWRHSDKHIHHDVIELPNGNVLTSYTDPRTKDEAAAAGAIHGMGLISDGVVEIKPTDHNTGEIVWAWKFWDHLIQNKNASLPNYGEPSANPGRFDVNAAPPRMDGADWCHLNAVDYNAELDQVAMSCRNFAEVFVVDHSTTTEEAASHSGGRSGRGGDILWRWGNPQNYGQGTAENQRFNGQHDVHWVASDVPGRSVGKEPSNTIMVFNNINTTLGPSPPEERSTADILQLPAPDPATGVYPYPKPDAAHHGHLPLDPSFSYGLAGINAMHISSAQRMGNGNTILTDGETGRIVEATPDGAVVWDWYWQGSACAKPYGAVPPYTPRGNCIFRSYRFPASYPGLAGRDLKPNCSQSLIV